MKKVIIGFLCLIITLNIYAEKVIDSMESKTVWEVNDHDGASEVDLTLINGVKGNAINIHYDMKTKDFIEISKEFKTIDLTKGDTIQWKMKVSGSKNTFKMIFKDDADDSVETCWNSMEPTAGSFMLYNISIASLNNYINPAKVTFMKLELNNQGDTDESGSGTYTIGSVGLYQTNFVTESTTVVDDFDDNEDNTNTIGFTNIIYKNGSGDETISVVNSGTNYLTLDFTKATGSPSDEYYWLSRCQTNNIVVGSPGLDVSDKSVLRFRIKGKDSGEKIGIKLQDTSYIGDVVVLEEMDQSVEITTSWQWVKIDLGDFGSSYDKSNLYQILIVFVHKDHSSLGQSDITIYLDDVEFYSPEKNPGLVETIDPMDITLERSPWIKAAGGVEESGSQTVNPQVDVSIVDTEIGKATKIDYAFNDGTWIVMERYFALNLFEFGGFSFDFKGENSENNLEVKLEDSDGTRYKKKFYKFTDTDDKWKNVQLDLTKDLVFEASGTDGNLKLKNITKIYFDIIKEGGTWGDVAIDNIKIGDYVFDINTKGKLITDFKISPNPFSPDNDNVEDIISFIYTLSEKAKITLGIYDLKGNIIKKLSSENYIEPGEDKILTWDGKDYAKKVSKNGLYIIKFKAEATDGKEEDIKSVISVLK